MIVMMTIRTSLTNINNGILPTMLLLSIPYQGNVLKQTQEVSTIHIIILCIVLSI